MLKKILSKLVGVIGVKLPFALSTLCVAGIELSIYQDIFNNLQGSDHSAREENETDLPFWQDSIASIIAGFTSFIVSSIIQSSIIFLATSGYNTLVHGTPLINPSLKGLKLNTLAQKAFSSFAPLLRHSTLKYAITYTTFGIIGSFITRKPEVDYAQDIGNKRLNNAYNFDTHLKDATAIGGMLSLISIYYSKRSTYDAVKKFVVGNTLPKPSLFEGFLKQ
ncbi:MAG: hypothetical protein J0H68_01935 [Sphingobacteriia bacterium]|nr:hypothetical protein [Sphingobacteriia bacterium]